MLHRDGLFKRKRQVATLSENIGVSCGPLRSERVMRRTAARLHRLKASEASAFFVSTAASRLTGHLKMQISFAETQPKRGPYSLHLCNYVGHNLVIFQILLPAYITQLSTECRLLQRWTKHAGINVHNYDLI